MALLSIILAGGQGMAADIKGAAPNCSAPSLEGEETIDPAARPGKVVYLDFWASWCRPCAQSFPFLDGLDKELKPQGFEVIAINLDEERENALAFLKKVPVQFKVAMDPKAKCPRLYKVKGMPTSFLIDRHGRIRDMHIGFKDSSRPKIRKQIEALLAEP